MILTNVASRLKARSRSRARRTRPLRERAPRSGRARARTRATRTSRATPRSRARRCTAASADPSPATTTLTGRRHPPAGDGINQVVDVVLLADRADVGEEVVGAVPPARIGRHLRQRPPFGTTSESPRSSPSRTARARYSSLANTTRPAAAKLRRSIAPRRGHERPPRAACCGNFSVEQHRRRVVLVEDEPGRRALQRPKRPAGEEEVVGRVPACTAATGARRRARRSASSARVIAWLCSRIWPATPVPPRAAGRARGSPRPRSSPRTAAGEQQPPTSVTAYPAAASVSASRRGRRSISSGAFWFTMTMCGALTGTPPEREPAWASELAEIGVAAVIASIENARCWRCAARPPERLGAGSGRAPAPTSASATSPRAIAAGRGRRSRRPRPPRRTPPTSVATTGRPTDIASSTDIGSASTALVRQTTSAACMMSSASAR